MVQPAALQPIAQQAQTYIGPEETTSRKNILEKVAIFGILLGSGLLVAPFFSAFSPISFIAGAAITAVSTYAFHYLSNIDSSLALTKAAEAGNRCMLNFLLFLGANPNANSGDSNRSARAWSALARAAASGHSDIIRALLNAGADPNADLGAKSALSGAAASGHSGIIRALLNADADPNTTDWLNQTPLLEAVRANQDDAVEILLEHGADPTIQTRDIDPLSNTIDEAFQQQASFLNRPDLDHCLEGDMRTRDQRVAAANRIAEMLRPYMQE